MSTTPQTTDCVVENIIEQTHFRANSVEKNFSMDGTMPDIQKSFNAPDSETIARKNTYPIVHIMRSTIIYGLWLVIFIVFSSCNRQKLLLTENEGPLMDLLQIDSSYEHVIRPDDKLSLSVWDHNDLSVGSVYSIYNSNESFGKWILVDKFGMVEIPKIGTIELGGKTTREATEFLREIFRKQIKKPVIVVKILNKTVTILGEVRSPGSFIMEKERTTVTEAIGKAQGFTDYANIKQIRLVRNDISYPLNLEKLSDDLLHKIILQADDIIVVPAYRGKVIDQKAPTIIPFSSALTAIVLVLSILN